MTTWTLAQYSKVAGASNVYSIQMAYEWLLKNNRKPASIVDKVAQKLKEDRWAVSPNGRKQRLSSG